MLSLHIPARRKRRALHLLRETAWHVFALACLIGFCALGWVALAM